MPLCSWMDRDCHFSFSALAGYGDLKAKSDLDQFFGQVARPRGIHLCGGPDWDFLLNLDLDVLSLDVYTNEEIFAAYATAIGKFLDQGGVIVWGIVPTGFEAFAQEEIPSLIQRLGSVWKILWSHGGRPVLKNLIEIAIADLAMALALALLAWVPILVYPFSGDISYKIDGRTG